MVVLVGMDVNRAANGSEGCGWLILVRVRAGEGEGAGENRVP